MATDDAARAIIGDRPVQELITRVLQENCSPGRARAMELGEWAADLWRLFVDSGLAQLGGSAELAEGVHDAAELLLQSGRYALPLPIAESGLLGGWLLTTAGIEAPPEGVTVPLPDRRNVVEVEGKTDSPYVRLGLHAVPWADECRALVTVTRDGDRERVLVVPRDRVEVERARNLAGEPRDRVFARVALGSTEWAEVPAGTSARLAVRGALSRALLIAGALERCVELAAEHAATRRQFGRSVGDFQAVQHMWVLAYEHAIASRFAALGAADAMAQDSAHARGAVVAARAAIGHSAAIVTKNAHQLVGAAGVTREHDLNLFTRRVWAWNLEWHSPRSHARTLARHVMGHAEGSMWDAIGRLDPSPFARRG